MQLKDAIRTMAAIILWVPVNLWKSSSRLATSHGSNSGACFPAWAAELNRYGLTTQWSTWKSAPRLAAHHFRAACIDAEAVGPPQATSFRNWPSCKGLGDPTGTSCCWQNLIQRRKAELRAPERFTDSLDAPIIVASRRPRHWRGSASCSSVTPSSLRSRTYLRASSNMVSSLACRASSSLLKGSGPDGPLNTENPAAPPVGWIVRILLETGGGFKITSRAATRDPVPGFKTLGHLSWTTDRTWSSLRLLDSRQAVVQAALTCAASPSLKVVRILSSSSCTHWRPESHNIARSAQLWIPRSQSWPTTSLGRATSRSSRTLSSSSGNECGHVELAICGDRDLREREAERRVNWDELSGLGICVSSDLHCLRVTFVCRVDLAQIHTLRAKEPLSVASTTNCLGSRMPTGFAPTVREGAATSARLSSQSFSLPVDPLGAEGVRRPWGLVHQTSRPQQRSSCHTTMCSRKEDACLLLDMLPVSRS